MHAVELHPASEPSSGQVLAAAPPADGPSEEPPPSPYLTGNELAGKYRLVRVLGEGGMGSVWEAHHNQLDIPVAIKLIRGDLDRILLRERLVIEARAAAKLVHPNIVRVFDVEESSFGDPFIVMELLYGEPLSELLGRGRLSAARAVQLLLPIADALAVAHSKGIVHRDLKPDNVFLSRDADDPERITPKLFDFGIVKLVDSQDAERPLTQLGGLVGSPEYMSPEQVAGRGDLDHRTDIWSFCVLLYEATTGSTPFDTATLQSLLLSILEGEPRPITAFAAGDPALWSILQRGLSKDREARQRSMSELGRALAGWLVSHGIHEDACGVSLHAKWLQRSSDPTHSFVDRSGDRATLPSAELQDELGRRLVAASPVSPAVLVSTPPQPSRRLLATAAVLFVLGAGGAFAGLGGARTPGSDVTAEATLVHASLPAAGAVTGLVSTEVTRAEGQVVRLTTTPPAPPSAASEPAPAPEESDSKRAGAKAIGKARGGAVFAAKVKPVAAAKDAAAEPAASRDAALDLISPY